MANPIDSSANLAIDAKGIEGLRRSAREKSPEALKETARQFEALFMNMIMKSMRDASGGEGLFDTEQTKMYTSMLDQQLSQNLAGKGVGLAEVLVRQLSASMGSQPATDGAMPAASMHPAESLQARRYNPWQPPSLTSQPPHVQAFQERLGAHADEASRTTGIPAKFMLAQAALESGWGRKEILHADGSTSHNLFGIKATGNWTGKTVEVATTEYVNGVAQKKMEKFRAYDSYADSFRDYANLLKNNPRYQNVIANGRDASAFAEGLQAAGYATDPNYAAKLSRIIKQSLSS